MQPTIKQEAYVPHKPVYACKYEPLFLKMEPLKTRLVCEAKDAGTIANSLRHWLKHQDGMEGYTSAIKSKCADGQAGVWIVKSNPVNAKKPKQETSAAPKTAWIGNKPAFPTLKKVGG